MEETLIYREEAMGKRKKIWESDEERDAWDRHVDETIRNLRELAGGRAEREHREKLAREAEAANG